MSARSTPTGWGDAAWVFALALVVYLLTGGYRYQSVDTTAASEAAWVLARTGSLDLSAFPWLDNRWFFDTAGGVYANRYPGVIVYALPAYLVADALGSTSLWTPGVVSAAIVSAGAAALTSPLLRGLGLPRHVALGGVLVFAFGSATWAVSADAQWPHGIDQLLVVAGMLALSRGHLSVGGLAIGMTVLVRPQLAPAVAAVGLWLAWRAQSWRPLVTFGAPALVGTTLLVGFNGLVLDRWAVSNGLTLRLGNGVLDLPANLALTVVDIHRGMLWVYPALLVCLLGLRRAWRQAPSWVQATAISAVIALLTQLSLNRFTGGDTFAGSRLTIEPLTLAFPLLVLAFTQAPRLARRVGVVLLGWSVVAHAMGAIGYPFVESEEWPASPTYPLTAVVAALASLGTWWLLRRISRTSDQRGEPVVEQAGSRS